MAQEDQKCIAEVLAGNNEAYRLIVDRYKGKIFYLGLKFFSHSHDAEDFAQDVFLRAFEKLKNYKGKGSFGGWLSRLAFNLAVNRYRMNKRKLLEGELVYDIPSSLPPLETRVLGKIEQEAVEQEIEQLTPGQQLVFQLHFFEGFSYEEISEISELPIGTIKSHIFRGRKRLKERLEHYG